MRVANLIISITDFQDNLALARNEIVSAIFSLAEEVVENGGKIIIQQEYENAPPDLVRAFSTIEEVRNWKQQLTEVQTILKRGQID
jgi:hypothetical protein